MTAMRPRRLPDLQAEDLPSGETVIVRPEDGKAVVLNAMGGVVWELCDGHHELGEIAGFICAQLADAPQSRVAEDVEALTQQLVEAGLLEDMASCGRSPSAR
jgi:hypothetical protein